MKSDNKNQWLKDSGIQRQYDQHRKLGCTYPGIFALLFVISLCFIKTAFWLPVIPLLLGIASYKYSKWMFFRKIYCPKCGYNPTLRKADKEPRKDYYKVLAQLERYEVCPRCGEVDEDEIGD